MTHPQTGTRRIAIGMFSDYARLASAIDEFGLDALEAKRLCLVGRNTELRSVFSTVDHLAAPGLRDVLDRAIVVALLTDGSSLMATPGCLYRGLIENGALASDLTKVLDQRLRHGTVLLLIGTVDTHALRTATRVLLRYSVDHVRTRDFPACGAQ